LSTQFFEKYTPVDKFKSKNFRKKCAECNQKSTWGTMQTVFTKPQKFCVFVRTAGRKSNGSSFECREKDEITRDGRARANLSHFISIKDDGLRSLDPTKFLILAPRQKLAT
jgi:hypothetical protein